ncbi:ATPase subunit d [Intoshia linei]|uniref:ATPase subunit d n=1 Tax=Intoshia linei TaxID=1819745 RepID=A0A177B4H0_9BILA|nr:ATPase subunit d [Intoshia linei]
MSKVSKIGKSIDWFKFAKSVGKSDIVDFKSFKSLCDKYFLRVYKLPENLPKIDFATYRSKLPSNMTPFVEKLEKDYKSLNIQYPVDKENSIAKFEKILQQETIKVDDFEKKANSALNDLTELGKAINSLPNFEEVTMEMLVAYFPDLYDPENKPSMWPHDIESQPESTLLDDPDHPKWFGIPKNAPHLSTMRK